MNGRESPAKPRKTLFSKQFWACGKAVWSYLDTKLDASSPKSYWAQHGGFAMMLACGINCPQKTPGLPKPLVMPKKELLNLIRKHSISTSEKRDFVTRISKFLMRNSGQINSPNFRSITNEDLGTLFQVTDELYFDGLVSRVCERESRPLVFRLSKRMITTGGMTTHFRTDRRNGNPDNTQFEIAIATTPLFKSFVTNKTANVSGLRCKSRIEALQRIMQHEMAHLIELLLWDDSNCAQRRFKGITNRFFGHKESNHQLATPGEYSVKQYGIGAGDWVSFAAEGIHRIGFVNRITKRATVLVPDSKGTRYDDGKRYTKYYVPLNRLRRYKKSA